MKCFVDLHIHSCLSPCGDDLMTPNNIAGMAYLKKLDMIAVADHNTAGNLPVIDQVCRAFGVALLPAIELTTREEVHMLAYFRTVEAACALSDAIYPYLPPIKNRREFFGAQLKMDIDDQLVGEEERLLISALDLPIEELAEKVYQFGGLPVPAHINRGNNGLLNVLGFLPPGVRFAALEVSKGLPLMAPIPDQYAILHSSDAHRLDAMFEREEWLELETPDADGFFQYLCRDRH